MDLKLIQRLIAMMKRGGVAELDIEDKESGLKVKLTREGAGGSTSPLVQVIGGGGVSAGYAPTGPAMTPSAPAGGAADAPAAPKELSGQPIPSPMVGTFYRAGSPEAEPFVSVGTRITPDKVLCIIEAMKVMNEIKAEVSGEIVEILAENGEPVEFGQPLFLVKTD
jgi:acetyl-CoA carboxylase biotin carboxyl carrier protein